MPFRLEEQSWLPEAPTTFSDVNRGFRESPQVNVSKLKELANTRLSVNQLVVLSKTIRYLNENKVNLDPLTEFRLGIIGQHTTSFISSTLPAAGARYGLNLKILEAEYSQLMQVALSPPQTFSSNKLDAILICLDHRELPFKGGVEDALSFINQAVEGLARHISTPLIFQTLSCPPASEFGSFDRIYDSSMPAMIRQINAHLIDLVKNSNHYLLDTETIAASIGLQNWHDPTQWHLYKIPYSLKYIPVHVDAIGRLIGAIRGKSRKCLVLDLDNTLWGGTIGDDGLDGIVLGQGDPTGEAHLNLQRTALALHKRGIILAVCSKNEDDNARLPFREHPDMILKEENFAVFVANWKDKATNLRKIASELNIALDALVFVDDNPAERLQVRKALPMVAVPELPSDASHYSMTLMNAGYFEAVTYSEDDQRRAEQYRANAARQAMVKDALSLEDYLIDLEMTLHVDQFNERSLTRVTQLINKTNQFNLTTQRLTQNEIEAYSRDPKVLTLQARLVDRFGDNGVVSVIAARMDGVICNIELWLMSCRVIGRTVERAMLDLLVTRAVQEGNEFLTGTFIPTQKNELVRDHYSNMGFTNVGEDADGKTFWKLELKNYSAPPAPIKIHSQTTAP